MYLIFPNTKIQKLISIIRECRQNSILQGLIRREAHQTDNKFQEFSEGRREFWYNKFNLFN